MDPEKTLEMAEFELNNGGSLSVIFHYLDTYWNWRQSNGFEPINGDNRAFTIEKTLDKRLCYEDS
jgi:hypothetical protein